MSVNQSVNQNDSSLLLAVGVKKSVLVAASAYLYRYIDIYISNPWATAGRDHARTHARIGRFLSFSCRHHFGQATSFLVARQPQSARQIVPHTHWGRLSACGGQCQDSPTDENPTPHRVNGSIVWATNCYSKHRWMCRRGPRAGRAACLSVDCQYRATRDRL
jgi:hypothetical protein